MPELPDVAAYIGALESRIVGQVLERVRLTNVFVLRTADPPLAAAEGRIVRELRRIGKRIAIGLGGASDFPAGSLVLTEAGTKRRASLHETNYCARCQAGSTLLADRSLSRLLKGDWPRTLEELDTLKRR